MKLQVLFHLNHPCFYYENALRKAILISMIIARSISLTLLKRFNFSSVSVRKNTVGLIGISEDRNSSYLRGTRKAPQLIRLDELKVMI